ncbi:MAG TPA: IS1380 family transposase, partial [Synergistaceae bacterium]|nr:IS1380 family transposase [Synergistaceae bacterium]
MLGTVPEGVKEVALRSDSAGYQAELLRFCNENPEKRFRRIYYGVSADVNSEFRAAAKGVSEAEWKPLKT